MPRIADGFTGMNIIIYKLPVVPVKKKRIFAGCSFQWIIYGKERFPFILHHIAFKKTDADIK